MTLEEAIEKLDSGLYADRWVITLGLKQAIQLGIEALKRPR